MNPKQQAVLDRIKHLEGAIAKGRAFLETGEHAHWHGFRPLFVHKVKNGSVLPPHKDWMRSVFIPRREKALWAAQDTLDRLTQDD